MSFYTTLDEHQQARVVDLVRSGLGRASLARTLSEELGRPVTEHQARSCLDRVRSELGLTPDEGNERRDRSLPFGPARFERQGDRATVVSRLTESEEAGLDADEDHTWLLGHVFSLDPEQWEIVPGSLRVRTDLPPADRPEAKAKRQYAATLQRRTGRIDDEAFAALVATRRPRPAPPAATAPTEATQVVCVADLQIGKKAAGGAVGLQRRWWRAVNQLERHFDDLETLERLPSRGLIVGLGDLIEQCVPAGQGLANTFECELTTSQQLDLALRLLDDLGDLMVETFEHVELAAVPGNHGERRGGGRRFTEIADNHDLDLFRQLQFAYGKNPDRYGHLGWHIADGLALVVETSGTTLAIAHGHDKIRGGGSSLDAKALQYWERAAFARNFNRGFHEADVFLTGHYHHLRVVDVGNDRLWIQAPALEGRSGSDWYAETGASTGATQGLLTFTTEGGRVRGLAVAGGEVTSAIA